MKKHNGLTNNRNLKRSDKICPRCFQEKVRKDLRKCIGCAGILLWDGDDASHFIQRRDGWYRWHKPVFGIIGWYSQDYFIGSKAYAVNT